MATDYTLKYQVLYQNKDNGELGRLYIYEDGYNPAGGVTTYRSEDPAIRWYWGDTAIDPLSPIVGSGMVVTIFDISAAIFDDLEAATEKQFFATYEIYSAGWSEQFRGWCRLDVAEKSTDSYDGFTSILITDGLKSLQEVKWVDSNGDLFDGMISLKDIVCDIFSRIDVSDDDDLTPLQLFTDVNLFDTAMASSAVDPLAELEHDASIFTKRVGSNDVTIAAGQTPRLYGEYLKAFHAWIHRERVVEVPITEPLSCYEVLTEICTALGVQIYQSPGAWHCDDVFRRMNASKTCHKYDLDGTADGTSTIYPQATMSAISSDALAGGRRGTIRPIKKASYVYEHETIYPTLLDIDQRTIDSGFYEQTGYNASGGSGRRVKWTIEMSMTTQIDPTIDYEDFYVPLILKLGSYFVTLEGKIQVANPNITLELQKGTNGISGQILEVITTDEIPAGNHAVYAKVTYPVDVSLDTGEDPATDLSNLWFDITAEYEFDDAIGDTTATVTTTENDDVTVGNEERTILLLGDKVGLPNKGLYVGGTTPTTEWAEAAPPAAGTGLSLHKLLANRRVRAFQQYVRFYQLTLHDDAIPPPGGSVTYSGDAYLLMSREYEQITNTAKCVVAAIYAADGNTSDERKTRTRWRGRPEIITMEATVGAETVGDGFAIDIRVKCSRETRSIIYSVSSSSVHPNFNLATAENLDEDNEDTFTIAGPHDYNTLWYVHAKPCGQTDGSGKIGKWKFVTIQTPQAEGVGYYNYDNHPELICKDADSVTTDEFGWVNLNLSGASDIKPQFALREGTEVEAIAVGTNERLRVRLDEDIYDSDVNNKVDLAIYVIQAEDATYADGIWLMLAGFDPWLQVLADQVQQADYRNWPEFVQTTTSSVSRITTAASTMSDNYMTPQWRAPVFTPSQRTAKTQKLEDYAVGKFWTTDADTGTRQRVWIKEIDRTNELATLAYEDGTEWTFDLTQTKGGSGPPTENNNSRAFDNLVEFFSMTDGPGDETGRYAGIVLTENATANTIQRGNFLLSDRRLFDSSDAQYFSSADTGGQWPSLDEDFWISMWWKSTDVNTDANLIGKTESNAANGEWEIRLEGSTPDIRFQTRDTAGAANTAVSAVSVANDTIYNVQVWWDVSTKTAYISVDDETAVTSVEADTPRSGADPLYIGGRSGTQPWDGVVGNISIWKRIPDSTTERTWHYNRGVPRRLAEYSNYGSTTDEVTTIEYALVDVLDQGVERQSDGHTITTRGLSNNNESYRVGDSSQTDLYVRFDGIDLDDETELDSAKLVFWGGYYSSDPGAAYSWTVTCNDVDDAPQVTQDAVNEISGMTDTTASVTWSGSDSWGTRTRHELDITDPVAEVLARGGWANGQAIGVITTWAAGNERQVCTFYEDPAFAPRLIINKISTAGPPDPTEDDIDFQLTASAQDANCNPTDGCVLDDDNLLLGEAAGESNVVVIYVPALGIQQAATIDNARFEFEVGAADTGQFEIDIFGVKHPTGSLPEAGENIWRRPRTSASARWITNEAWSTGAHVQSPDLAEILQELVNQPGWNTSSGAMFLFGPAIRIGEREVYAYDHDTGDEPRFICNFTYEPLPDPPDPVSGFVPSWEEAGFVAQFYDTATPSNSTIPLYYPSEMTWAGKDVAGDYVYVSKDNPKAEYKLLTDAILNCNNPPPTCQNKSLYPIERTRIIILDSNQGDVHNLLSDTIRIPEPPGGVDGPPFILAGDNPLKPAIVDQGFVDKDDLPANGDRGQMQLTDCRSLVTNIKFQNFGFWRMWGNRSIFLNLEYYNTWGDIHSFRSGPESINDDGVQIHGDHQPCCAVVGVAAYYGNNRVQSVPNKPGKWKKNVGQHLVYSSCAKNEVFDKFVCAHNVAMLTSGCVCQLWVNNKRGTTSFTDELFTNCYVVNNLGWENLRFFQNGRSGCQGPVVKYNTHIRGDNWLDPDVGGLLEEMWAVHDGDEQGEYSWDDERVLVWQNIDDGVLERNIFIMHKSNYNIVWAWGPAGDDYPSGSVDYNHWLAEGTATYHKGVQPGTQQALDANFTTTWAGANGTVNNAPNGATDPDDIAESNWDGNPLAGGRVAALLAEIASEISATEGAGVICEIGPKWLHSEFGF